MLLLVKKLLKLHVIVEQPQFDNIKLTETTHILASYNELGPSKVPNPVWWLGDVELSYQNSLQGLPVECVFSEWVAMTLITRPNDTSMGANTIWQPLHTPAYLAWEM